MSAPTPSAGADVRVDGFALAGRRPLGCLLVHGFTGAPDEMRPLGEALAAAGFPVRAVRLPGHGTCVDDLARARWPDWVAAVADGAAALGRGVPRVAVAGMSMGALLALHLAATDPGAVAALVLCSTALAARDRRLRLLPLLEHVPWLARRFALLPKTDRRDIADVAARTSSFTYDAVPLAAAAELVRLQRAVRRELPRITQPALLLHGRHDHTIAVAETERLRRRLGSRWIEAHVLERSWHVITLDVERAEVGRLAADFLARVEAAG
ncbi:MAG TPA: alpha/beta fold hydrolase [Candidatus Binatia bacterium]|nr:alpha/beta fold hydrolase [Candidatus Binatia bacterium]